jgi:hypothetical protein
MSSSAVATNAISYQNEVDNLWNVIKNCLDQNGQLHIRYPRDSNLTAVEALFKKNEALETKFPAISALVAIHKQVSLLSINTKNTQNFIYFNSRLEHNKTFSDIKKNVTKEINLLNPKFSSNFQTKESLLVETVLNCIQSEQKSDQWATDKILKLMEDPAFNAARLEPEQHAQIFCLLTKPEIQQDCQVAFAVIAKLTTEGAQDFLFQQLLSNYNNRVEAAAANALSKMTIEDAELFVKNHLWKKYPTAESSQTLVDTAQSVLQRIAYLNAKSQQSIKPNSVETRISENNDFFNTKVEFLNKIESLPLPNIKNFHEINQQNIKIIKEFMNDNPELYDNFPSTTKFIDLFDEVYYVILDLNEKNIKIFNQKFFKTPEIIETFFDFLGEKNLLNLDINFKDSPTMEQLFIETVLNSKNSKHISPENAANTVIALVCDHDLDLKSLRDYQKNSIFHLVTQHTISQDSRSRAVLTQLGTKEAKRFLTKTEKPPLEDLLSNNHQMRIAAKAAYGTLTPKDFGTLRPKIRNLYVKTVAVTADSRNTWITQTTEKSFSRQKVSSFFNKNWPANKIPPAESLKTVMQTLPRKSDLYTSLQLIQGMLPEVLALQLKTRGKGFG